jgi:hypothetical protein
MAHKPIGPASNRVNADRRQGTAYYAFDRGIVRCVVLDTVNEHGSWQGSPGRRPAQLAGYGAARVRGPARGAVQPSTGLGPGVSSVG